MSKNKKKFIIATIIVLVMATIIPITVWLVFVFGNKINSPPIDEDNLQVFMDGDYYLGNLSYGSGITTTATFSLIDILGLSETDSYTIISNDPELATVSGTNITIHSTGELDLLIKNITKDTEEDRMIYVVEGINVSDFTHLFYAIEQKQSVIIHSNILLANPSEGTYEITPTNGDSFNLYANMYGNGYKLDCSDILTYTIDSAFNIKAANVTIRDTHFIGKNLIEEDTLSALENSGIILDVNSEPDFQMTGILVENCIMENAHKIVAINYADITIRGCIIRNASDSCISIQTNNDGTSNINIENCVISNATIACITFWCIDDITSPNNFVTLNITGFLDLYNWRSIENSQIVPNTEDLAGTVNPIIQQWMKRDEYVSYYYSYKGQYYLHSGIIIISTPPSQGNIPVINGLEGVGLTRRNFPFPEFAKQWIKTCDVCGYVDNPSIKPDSKMSDNENLYRELREGRD